MKHLVMATLGALLLAGSVGCGYDASLTATDVAPPTPLRAEGSADFHYDKDSGELKFEVTVKDIENVTGAQIHLGRKLENGPTVLTLYVGRKDGVFSDTLVKGTAVGGNLAGPLAGRPMQDLIDAFDEERAYIIVNTEQFPDGAIRGQILDKPWFKFW